MNFLGKALIILFLTSFQFVNFAFSQGKPQWVLVLHGGAGNIKKELYTDAEEKQYLYKLGEALDKGGEILENGGSAIDAIEIVISILEDSPLFNAGKGAVFNSEGINELDAAIMDGKSLKAGTAAGLTDVKNPIYLARKIMDNSKHVMLIGKGASAFAREMGLKIVDNSYFFTNDRWNQLQNDKEKENGNSDSKGTVGCVALDKYGNLAAGTSTGGMSNKKWGRVGDSPIIGAGTYANNLTCAVSCTGHGEYFIRYTVAYDLSALIEYKNMSLKKASEYIINDKLVKAGGKGGLIAVDKYGNIAMPFNTEGMFRAYIRSDKKKEVLMYK